MNAYVQRVLDATAAKNANEPEFLQTVEEVLTSLAPVVDRHPEYEKAALLERLVEPDRVFQFRVTWTDDAGVPHVNRGYRSHRPLQGRSQISSHGQPLSAEVPGF